jgi:acetyl esterase/lipase
MPVPTSNRLGLSPSVQGNPPLVASPANTSHIKRKFVDVPYADLSATQKLDIYLPDIGDNPFPVIAYIHGGAFRYGDKGDSNVMPILEGLKRNYAVVSINYRLSGEAKFPALVYDVKAAVRWIRANAEQYHFNPDKIAAWGASAGAYLSTMLGVSARVMELNDLSLGNAHQPSNVQAVVNWFGPMDFLKMDEQLAESGLTHPEIKHNAPNSPESLLMGQPITEVPGLIYFANPESYISSNACPFLIQHGTKDMIVPVQQSINLAAKLEKAIGKKNVILELLPDAEHADSQFETTQNVNKVLDFLDRCLK